MRAMEISRSGLDVEWQRLQVIAANLANLNTTRVAGGEPFRPMRLLSATAGDFAQLISSGSNSTAQLQGVRVTGTTSAGGGVRKVREPGHPHADAEGFVTYPDLDHASEMALLIKTSRIYEANLTAMNIAHQMYAKALELGRQS